MPENDYRVPLSLALGDVWPRELVELITESPLNEVLGALGITRLSVSAPAHVEVTIDLGRKLALEIPGLQGVAFVFGSDGADHSALNLAADLRDPFYLALEEFPVRLRFPRSILRPVIAEDGDYNEDPDPEHLVEIGISPTLGFSADAGLFVRGLTTIEVTSAFMLGDTGFLVVIPSIALFLSEGDEPPEGLPDGWRGVFIERAEFRLPEAIEVEALPEALIFEQCGIGSGGFSGTVSADWSDEPLRASLAGFGAVLKRLAFTLQQSAFVESEIEGELELEFFDAVVGFLVSISGEGRLKVTLSGATRGGENGSEDTPDGLITFTQPDLLTMTVESLSFDNEEGIFRLSMSGRLKPLLAGLEWPELAIERLSIDANGNVDFDGGWLNLSDQYTLDFHGFKITLSEIGFGKEEDSPRQWIGLSGGIQLVQGIPLSASVDGLEVSWDPTVPGNAIRAKLEGVAVSLEIPNTLSLRGEVRYEEIPDERLTGFIFRGQIELDIAALRMELTGDLVIGRLAEVETGETFEVAYVVLSAQFPAAIPLGATGAGLYGLLGLVGVNIAPDRHTAEETLDGLEPWYEWYKADRGGDSAGNVTKMQKWSPRRDHYAFGAGITIGTVFDDGFTINLHALLAVFLPGPVIMIEGRANLLKQRTGDGDISGAFYALAVFDGNAGTFQLNVDVQLELEDVITVGGGGEAFFYFNDSTRWHLWLGQEDPESKRIRAQILSLFQVSAYLMIDNNGLMTGAKAALEIRETWGPLSLVITVGLSFDAGIFWNPQQCEGRIELFGEILFRIFGIGLGILLRLLLEAKAAKPFWVHGLARFAVTLPFPLPSFDVEVEFTWQEPIEPEPVWPLLKGAALTHHLEKDAAWMLSATRANAPVVPVDAVPVLEFMRPLGGRSYRVLVGGALEYLGNDPFDDFVFTYECSRVALFEVASSRSEPVALHPIGSDISDVQPFDFSAESFVNGTDAQQPEWRLWKYDHLPGASSYEREDGAGDLDPCRQSLTPQPTCVRFARIASGFPFGRSFSVSGWQFRAQTELYVRGGRLETTDLWIRFPRPMGRVDISMSGQAEILAYCSGRRVGGPRTRDVGDSLLAWTVENPVTGVDALHIRAISSFTAVEPVRVASVCATDRGQVRAAEQLSQSRETAAARGDDVRRTLMLRPNTEYRLEVDTRVLISYRGSATSERRHEAELYFRTGDGPGAASIEAAMRAELERRAREMGATDADLEQRVRGLHFGAGPLNTLTPYVADTNPNASSDPFYFDQDVSVMFHDAYVPAMYSAGHRFAIRYRDRNGATFPELEDDRSMWIAPLLPLLSDGWWTFEAARQRDRCPRSTAPESETRRLTGMTQRANLRPRRRYTAEVLLLGPDVEHRLHEFSFVTSSYATPVEVLESGLRDGALITHVLATPIAWSESMIGGLRAEWVGIAAARAALRSAFEARDRFGVMERREEAVKLVDAYAAHAQEMFSALTATPPSALRPQTLELFVMGAPGSMVLRLESPEPFDWSRWSIALRSESGTSRWLFPVWSVDRTGAFLFDAASGGGITSGSFELVFVRLEIDALDRQAETVGGAPYGAVETVLPFMVSEL